MKATVPISDMETGQRPAASGLSDELDSSCHAGAPLTADRAVAVENHVDSASAPALGESIVWRVHPARERLAAALSTLAVVAALAWLSAELMDSAWWGVFSFVGLLLALNRFFLPSEFRVDDRGVAARYPLQRQCYRWSDIRRFVYDRRGGYLSIRRRPSMFDGFRGMHLTWGDDREAVITRIRRNLPMEDRPPCNG